MHETAMPWFRSSKDEKEKAVWKLSEAVAQALTTMCGRPKTDIPWERLDRHQFLLPWFCLISLSKIFAEGKLVPWQLVMKATALRIFGQRCYGGSTELEVPMFIALSAVENAKDQGHDVHAILVDVSLRMKAKRFSDAASRFYELESIAKATSIQPHPRVGTFFRECKVLIDHVVAGISYETWIVGRDIEWAQYEQFKDEDGNLYLTVHYDGQKEIRNLVTKEMYPRIKAAGHLLHSLETNTAARQYADGIRAQARFMAEVGCSLRYSAQLVQRFCASDPQFIPLDYDESGSGQPGEPENAFSNFILYFYCVHGGEASYLGKETRIIVTDAYASGYFYGIWQALAMISDQPRTRMCWKDVKSPVELALKLQRLTDINSEEVVSRALNFLRARNSRFLSGCRDAKSVLSVLFGQPDDVGKAWLSKQAGAFDLSKIEDVQRAFTSLDAFMFQKNVFGSS